MLYIIFGTCAILLALDVLLRAWLVTHPRIVKSVVKVDIPPDTTNRHDGKSRFPIIAYDLDRNEHIVTSQYHCVIVVDGKIKVTP